ncbi:MAG: taurine dioxygenase [Candidatus Azotimanducaceae bacterium]|jgi:taurine dioxygenase
MLQLKPYSGKLGALVEGIDLRQSIDSEGLKELNDALLKYEVLFFRNQSISPEHHAQLASLFGGSQLHGAYGHVEGYPQITILENDRDNPSKIELWHTDMTFRSCPPLGSILHSVISPEKGGDTMFASMSAAFDALSPSMQDFLCNLTAIHDFSYGFKESLEEPGGRERLASMVLENPPVEHPVVRTHPESGKKGLFVNRLFTRQIKELTSKESNNLLEFLFDHVTKDEFTCRFSWQENSIAFWDNRITQHKPVNDYWPQHRKMQRITIDGDRPF